MNSEFNQRDSFYLRTAQAAEKLHAEIDGREPREISLDTPITLRMLAEILRDPAGRVLAAR
ncbi:hypothetical protein Brsp07_03000 [Brucella sp. NBRC 14130]|uniref:hypothetical protein n=1 Tax=Brucella sp. NBRC 14130 TaxID=3075483 RepID=UPI0030A1B928